MPTNHTPNYNLSQWQRTDKVLMEDFNADNAKIDAALKAHTDALAGKADSSKVDATLKAHADALAGKADSSIIDATLKAHADALAGKAETSALAALAEQVGTRNCRAYTTRYAGDGTASYTITFPSKPWLILTAVNGIGTLSIRGSNVGVLINATSDIQLKVTWSENSVTLNHPSGYINPKNLYVTLFALIEA